MISYKAQQNTQTHPRPYREVLFVPVALFPPMSKVESSNYWASSILTVPLQKVVAWNGQRLIKLLDYMDCLESQVKAQLLEASASEDLHRCFPEAESRKE